MKANKKELALLRGKRTPETLEEWAKAFGDGDRQRAERYALAVATFLGGNPNGEWSDYLGQLSPNTRKAYAFSVAEFFEWAAAKHGRIVPPHQVIRKDAEDYVNWLANRPFSLAEEKLKDGDMEEEAALFEIIKTLRSANIIQIAKHLSAEHKQKYFGDGPVNFGARQGTQEWDSLVGKVHRLSQKVRELVTLDVVAASPTLSELRKQHPQAGITEWMVGATPLANVFTYTMKQSSAASRTTIALRIAALSSFWKVLMQGENLTGGEALLQYNIWDAVKKRVTRGIAPMKRAAAKQQKMSSEAVQQMLSKAPSRTLVEKRNRAIFYLMVFAGLRVTEVLLLRRGDTGNKKMPYFDGSEPPALQILRKGNKWMRLPYPPIALQALTAFQSAMDTLAATTENQWVDDKDEHYLRKDHIAYRYRDLQLPDAPLFPALAFWGNNVRGDYRKSMSRIQLYRLLKDLAANAGVEYEQVKKTHPHALRHFAANAMLLGGKDLREIQQLLGHTSITTTEGYFEDIEDAVKLSGQAEILKYLQSQGVTLPSEQRVESHEEQPAPVQKKQPQVIDTYAVPVEEEEIVTREEVAVLNSLTEVIPPNKLPEIPDYEPPDVQVVSTAEGEVLVEGKEMHLIGLVDEETSDEVLEQIIEQNDAGKSSGSPDHVYEALQSGIRPEEVVFNRGGQKDIGWLLDHYPKTPKDFGVGKKSLLPWFVKAKGNVSASGFHGVQPPFPLWSPDQVNPVTMQGEFFISGVEEMYAGFLQGNPAKGEAPSPIRSTGLIRWFGFFAYLTNKYLKEVGTVFVQDQPVFEPWDALIDTNGGGAPLRTHKNEWLLAWLRKNAHTFRASVDAMKRGIPKGDPRGGELKALKDRQAERDIEKFFLRASFEGVDLIDKMPDWMIENDPVNALYKENPAEYEKFIKWLANTTGQALSVARKDERLDTVAREKAALLEKVQDALKTYYKGQDEYIVEERKGKAGQERVKREALEEARIGLFTYFVTAAKNREVEYDVKGMNKDISALANAGSNTKFNTEIAGMFKKHGVPNPSDQKYRDIPRINDRIAQLARDSLPADGEEAVLADVNIFADSALFDPRWFRIDAKKKTIYIEKEAAEDLQREYGLNQSPLLLVRRAARAMYEAKDKGYDKLWGVMMSYFSWIVPTGAAMESEARGIPIKETGSGLDARARRAWLSDWVKSMRELAEGDVLKKAIREKSPEAKESVPLDEVQVPVRDRYKGAHELAVLDETVLDLFADPEWEKASPEGMYGAKEADLDEYDPEQDVEESDEDDVYSLMATSALKKNRRVGYTKNGKDLYIHMEGEKPSGWYKVNVFGDRTGMRKNPGTVKYVSPAVMYEAQKRIAPARALLPSPFRMIAAMSQE